MNDFEIYVIADNIRSLYNVGSLFRLCDGVGIRKLYLCGRTGAPFNRLKYQRQRQQIAKTALEGLNSVEWEHRDDVISLIEEFKNDGIQVVALEQSDSSINYAEASYHPRVCLVVGNEVDGVGEKVLELMDMTVEIPMYGRGNSLNVISATSVALYQIRTQHLHSGSQA